MEVEGRGSRKKGVGGLERGSRRERAKEVWREEVGSVRGTRKEELGEKEEWERGNGG